MNTITLENISQEKALVNLKIIHNKNYFLDNKREIKKLLRKHLFDLKKNYKEFKYHIQTIENAVNKLNGLLFWVIEEDDGIKGFITTQSLYGNGDSKIMLLRHFNADRIYLDVVSKFAKEQGYFKVITQASSPFNAGKWLGNGWKMTNMIFERIL